jgi:pimeloyl-ACP methyl ester carboxylesterase
MGVQRVLRLWRLLSLPCALGLVHSHDLAQLYLRRPPPHLPGYRTKWELSFGFDGRPWLGSIGCPTFVLTGTFDPIVPIRAGLEFAELIPNARLQRLSGGHLVYVARASEAGLIADWVRDSL